MNWKVVDNKIIETLGQFNYRPIINTTLMSDEEIELWFGSKIVVKIIRDLEDSEIRISGNNTIGYYKNNILILEYMNFDGLILPIESYRITYLRTFKQLFGYKINDVNFMFKRINNEN